MKFTLGISPCPNDTFIFDALINQKINTEGFSFEVILEDVETLNLLALEGKLDITKLSLPAFFRSLDHYSLLNAGSALGKGVGPLLISNKDFTTEQFLTNAFTVAIPGLNTTANMLFDFAFPGFPEKINLKYHEIENYLLRDNISDPKFGVIIHENRFTYQEKGLFKIMDLGNHWETKMNTAIPLGSIAIKKSLDKNIKISIDQLIKKSLEYSFATYPLLSDFVKQNAQELEEDIMRKHIDLYVNEYSLNLGIDGRKSIEKLFEIYLFKNPSSKNSSSSSLFAN